jgi:hypothetical protein
LQKKQLQKPAAEEAIEIDIWAQKKDAVAAAVAAKLPEGWMPSCCAPVFVRPQNEEVR